MLHVFRHDQHQDRTGIEWGTGALFEGLAVPADSAAVLKRSTAPRCAARASAVRNQVELRACDLDSALPADPKPAPSGPSCSPLIFKACTRRSVPSKAASGARHRPAILMSLWLYRDARRVGSARELDRLCDSDDAYRWLCGGWV